MLEPLAEDAAHERSRRSPTITRRAREALEADARRPPTSRCRRTGSISAKTNGRPLDAGALARLTPFADAGRGDVVDAGTRPGRNFAPERAEAEANVFDAVTKHVHALQAAGKRVVIALWSEGSRERMSHVLADHGLANLTNVANYAGRAAAAQASRSRSRCSVSNPASRPTTSRSSASRTFSATAWCAAAAPRSAPEDFIAEVDQPRAGDLVVHVDHGIGRFAGLQTIEAAGAPHDCLELHYADGAKLFLPVENIELLSRYGSEDTDVAARPARRRRLADAQGAA